MACALELTKSLASFAKAGQSLAMEPAVKSLEELFGYLISVLNSVEVPYMIVGSFASTYHGVAQATQYLDIVCELRRSQLDHLSKAFDDPDFYLNQAAAEQALQVQGMFNLVHIPTGWKIDFILRRDRPFSRREFARRVAGEILGRAVFVASPEDTILAKLEWAKESLSERQLRDVAEIFDIQGQQIDRGYIEDGIRELQLEDVLKKVRGPW